MLQGEQNKFLKRENFLTNLAIEVQKQPYGSRERQEVFSQFTKNIALYFYAKKNNYYRYFYSRYFKTDIYEYEDIVQDFLIHLFQKKNFDYDPELSSAITWLDRLFKFFLINKMRSYQKDNELLLPLSSYDLDLLDLEVTSYSSNAKTEEYSSDVQQEFENYLQVQLGQGAVQWLQLYLQGKSQEEIAKRLNKSIREVYRLREKISYHAQRVFALKGKPELVESWLGISLKNNLGLTQKQWQQLLKMLTTTQRRILELRKAGNNIEEVAQQLELKTYQVIVEWTKIRLGAQNLRRQE